MERPVGEMCLAQVKWWDKTNCPERSWNFGHSELIRKDWPESEGPSMQTEGCGLDPIGNKGPLLVLKQRHNMIKSAV